jgi:hypothetical protein
MKVYFFLLGLSVSILLSANDDVIVPDRPGFSTGTQTVKQNSVNVELGYQYSYNNHSPQQSSHTLPQMVLRTGISENAEFDLLWDGINIDKEEGSETLHSKADLSIGSKYKLLDSEDYHLAAIGILSLPTGSSPSTSGSTDPLVGLLWDYSISDDNALFGTVQASSSTFDQNRVYDERFSIGTSYSHTDTLSSFIEFFTIMPSESSLNDIKTIDCGMAYLLTNDIQLDFSVGFGLNKYSSNFIGFGIATRF